MKALAAVWNFGSEAAKDEIGWRNGLGVAILVSISRNPRIYTSRDRRMCTGAGSRCL